MLFAACTTRDPLNPLDPDHPDTGGAPRWLRALADDGSVDLAWDVPAFDDLATVRVVDLAGPDPLWTGAAGSNTLRHQGLANGVDRRYRLELHLDTGKVIELPEEIATPGPAVVFAVDAGSGTLVRLTPDGRDIRWRSTALDASSVRVDPDSARALVVEFFAGRVSLVDRDGGPRWSSRALANPLIALRTEDGWWVTDSGAGVVALFDDDGAVAYADSSFETPTGLAEAGDGAVWVADRGGFVARLERGVGVTRGPVPLGVPSTVAPAGDGGVWVGDRELAAVIRLDAEGRETARVENIAGIQGMAADPAVPGGLWVVERGQGRLLRLDAGGAVTPVVSGLPGPSSLVVSPDGDTIWVAEPGLGAVVRFDRAGTELGRSRGLAAPTSVAVAFDPAPRGP